jgi:hypothetical protein
LIFGGPACTKEGRFLFLVVVSNEDFSPATLDESPSLEAVEPEDSFGLALSLRTPSRLTAC